MSRKITTRISGSWLQPCSPVTPGSRPTSRSWRNRKHTCSLGALNKLSWLTDKIASLPLLSKEIYTTQKSRSVGLPCVSGDRTTVASLGRDTAAQKQKSFMLGARLEGLPAPGLWYCVSDVFVGGDRWKQSIDSFRC